MAGLPAVIVAAMVSAAAVSSSHLAVEYNVVTPAGVADEHATVHIPCVESNSSTLAAEAGLELTTIAAGAAASAATDIPEDELVDVTDHTVISGRTCIPQVCSAACKRAGHVAARCRGGCQCRDRRAGKARHHNRHSRTDGDEDAGGGNSNNNYNVNYNVNAVMPIPMWGGGGGMPPYIFNGGGMPPYGGTAPQQPMYPMYQQQGSPGMFPPGAYPQGMPPGQPFMPPMAPAPTAPPSLSAAALAGHTVSSYTSTAVPWYLHAADLSKGHAVSSKPQLPSALQPLVALPGLMAPTSAPPQAGVQPQAAEPPAPLQPLGSGPAPFDGERERPSYALPPPANVQAPSMLGAAPPRPQPYFGGGALLFGGPVSTDRAPHWGDGDPGLSRPVPSGGLVNLPGIINNPAMPAVAGPANAFRLSGTRAGAKPDMGGGYALPWQGGRR